MSYRKNKVMLPISMAPDHHGGGDSSEWLSTTHVPFGDDAADMAPVAKIEMRDTSIYAYSVFREMKIMGIGPKARSEMAKLPDNRKYVVQVCSRDHTEFFWRHISTVKKFDTADGAWAFVRDTDVSPFDKMTNMLP